ncbi:FadR/GntR family transcriptional regulator [Nocardia vermiculata]|uniref:FadR family transcriptional regulator n=1 Tax=Nocardia vermiculata TaxID=257274 RepID=A0A846XY69_9NOCA|nr:FCD domain-containing protein [Nocardia vermiculata]NKY51557.1 FadR family transcriptional regulator [Nocardia vermiculata]
MVGGQKDDVVSAGRGGRRLAETVAERIEADIIANGWRTGTILGSESELIERYGVSRAVFREAVRLVEHHQMAAMRRGPGGGLVVTEPDPGVVRHAARVYLRHAEVTREQLFQARMALELAGVVTATERLTEAGIARLNDALHTEQELVTHGVTTGHLRNLHSEIAELTGNPAITLFVEVLAQLDEEMVQQGWDSRESHPDWAEGAAASHQAHEAIVAAITSGDAALAQYRMRRHLQAIAAVLEEPPAPELVGSDAQDGDNTTAVR